jgi:hypothetical protein
MDKGKKNTSDPSKTIVKYFAGEAKKYNNTVIYDFLSFFARKKNDGFLSKKKNLIVWTRPKCHQSTLTCSMAPSPRQTVKKCSAIPEMRGILGNIR